MTTRYKALSFSLGRAEGQCWCQEQFLSQGRWQNKSFLQGALLHAPLWGTLKNLSPNRPALGKLRNEPPSRLS